MTIVICISSGQYLEIYFWQMALFDHRDKTWNAQN